MGTNIPPLFFIINNQSALHMSKDTSPHFDIAICGGGAVGKSSVTIQFVKSQFSEGDYDPVIF